MLRKPVLTTLLAVVLLSLPAFAATDISRATLKNGLRVIVIRNPLAPAVSVYDNYLVGANETPKGFPGMAHAQEHMLFRGCQGMSADQTAAIYAQLGGDNDADTQQNITQYFSTVPAQDLEVALHADAACMKGVMDSQSEWNQERGAIEQEVARDLSNPTYKLITRLPARHDDHCGHWRRDSAGSSKHLRTALRKMAGLGAKAAGGISSGSAQQSFGGGRARPHQRAGQRGIGRRVADEPVQS